jgi:hypothetical protein
MTDVRAPVNTSPDVNIGLEVGDISERPSAAEVCAPGAPLTYSNYKVWKIPSGATFDLRRRPAGGFYLVSARGGKLTSNSY